MAITKVPLKVLFAAANTVAIGTGLTNTSDLISVDATCVDASITVKALNAGVPAAGDTVDVFVLLSSGDADADLTNDFANADGVHSRWLCTLDTFISNPAIKTVDFPALPKNAKLYAVNNAAGSVTFSAVIEEMRA